MTDYTLAAVKIGQRDKAAVEVQKALTEFGCSIKVRLGLHDVPSDACTPSGLLILQLVDSEDNIAALLEKLNKIDAVTAKSLSI